MTASGICVPAGSVYSCGTSIVAHSRFFPHSLQVSGSGDGALAVDTLRSPEVPDEHPVRVMRAAANAAPY